jgi:hypothetical protein
LYFTLNVIKVIKSRRLNPLIMWENLFQKFSWKTRSEKTSLERPGQEWENNTKMYYSGTGVKVCTGFF